MKTKKALFCTLFLTLAGIGNVFAQNTFRISTGTQLITSGNVSLDYKGGNFINNGSIINSNGSIAFSAPVTFSGSGTSTTKRLKIEHSGTSILNNRINVTGSIEVSEGNLNANNNLTLISNATSSAVIAPIASGSDITGKVTVQRYIPKGKRAFRFLTPSVTTDDFISNNWQLTTHITGSTSGSGGFDATTTGNISLFTYNNNQATGSGWTPIATTNATNLEATKGYRLLVRGDRNVDINANSTTLMNNPITLSATGNLKTGEVVFNTASATAVNSTTNAITNGFSLLGNPYVNTLNWNTLSKTGLTDAYYSWDANMGSAAQRGRYVVYSSTTGTSNVASAVNQYIQPGQAFLIKNSTLGTAGNLTFQESDKVGTNINANFFKGAVTNIARLDLQIFDTNQLALGEFPIDAAVSVFDNQFTNTIENGDVVKLSTGQENISFFNSGTALAIDARPTVAITDELAIRLQEFAASKSYTFRTQFDNFDSATTPFLVDTYLNQYTSLSNNSTTDVVFTTTTDALSYSSNRFKIVFQNTVLSNASFDAAEVSLYPNPVTNGQFTIALPTTVSGEVKVKVINLLGQTVYQTTTQAQNNIKITTGINLPQAVYIVEINHRGKKVTKKITVK